MGYRITKLVFDEKQGITALEIRDDYGNAISPLNEQIKGNSKPNKDEFIELPDISAETLVFTPQKSVLDILTEFCKGKKEQTGVNLHSLKKFYEYYRGKAETWKGKFDINALWENWVSRERKGK